MDNRRLQKQNKQQSSRRSAKGRQSTQSPASFARRNTLSRASSAKRAKRSPITWIKSFAICPVTYRDGRTMAVCRLSRWPDYRKTTKRSAATYWLWACIDADTKLVFSHRVGKRDWIYGPHVCQRCERARQRAGQIATDNLPAYPFHIRHTLWLRRLFIRNRNKDIRRATTTGRHVCPLGTQRRRSQDGHSRARSGGRLAGLRQPYDFSHRTILFNRSAGTKAVPAQGARILQRPCDAQAAVALHLGVYNFVRKHTTLGTTPAVAAGVEMERWSLERVVEMTAEYMREKRTRSLKRLSRQREFNGRRYKRRFC